VIDEEMTETPTPDVVAQVEDSVQVFGRDIFSNPNLSFSPSENIATPEN
jgi:hypothetical protein